MERRLYHERLTLPMITLIFRSILDPVSIADRGAITVYTGSLNPFTNHDYITGYGDMGRDGSRSIEPVKEIL